MRCPFCGHQKDRVLHSRPLLEGAAIRRRRECLNCGRRFTTYEQVEETLLMVIKKDGRRERFDRNKILRGMMTACEKRPVSAEDLERVTQAIERDLLSEGRREVSSREIGERVIEALRHLDQVAYVRFASVYRNFQDIDQFKELVELLSQEALKSRKKEEV